MKATPKRSCARPSKSSTDRCLQDINEGDESSYIFKHHISRIERQLFYYDRTYAWQDDKDQAVVDYIASMTDGYFCELTSKLFRD